MILHLRLAVCDSRGRYRPWIHTSSGFQEMSVFYRYLIIKRGLVEDDDASGLYIGVNVSSSQKKLKHESYIRGELPVGVKE